MRPPRPPRLPDWTIRLAALLADWNARPFAWGQTDCAMLAAEAVVALTGVDPVADLRGSYSDATGAGRVLGAAGGLLALVAKMADRAGIPECPPAFAQRGDVALVEWQGAQALGIVMPDGVMVLGRDEPRMLHVIPASSIRFAWAV